MTSKELEKLYAQTCAVKGFEPNTGQFKVWKQTLGWIEERDLAEALTGWFATQIAFPMPAELKPLAMSAKRKRELEAERPRQLTIWQCPTCGSTQSGFITADDDKPRYCRSPFTGRFVGGKREQHGPDSDGNAVLCGQQMQVRYAGDERVA